MLLLVLAGSWNGLTSLSGHCRSFVLRSGLLNGRCWGLDSSLNWVSIIEGVEGEEVHAHILLRLGHGLRAGQLLDVKIIIVEVRVHVVVLMEMLVLVLHSAVDYLPSGHVIVLRVH